MTITPLVSVIIPAYNAAEFLDATIQSVRDQSYENWELLVVDDGSTDETAAIAERYHRLDSRVQHVAKVNGGVSSARNMGGERSHADLLAFLDADDLWLPHKLAVHVDYMNAHPEAGVSFARVELIGSDGSSTGKLTSNVVPQVPPHAMFYSNPTVTTSNLVIRKSLFLAAHGFDEQMQYNEDVDLLFRIALQQPKAQIQGIDQVLVQYRLHEGGLSSTLGKMEAGWLRLMEKASAKAPQLVRQHYQAAYEQQLAYLARQTLRLNLPAKAGTGFVRRAIALSGHQLYKKPKLLALTLLMYFKLITFDRIPIKI